MPDGSLATPSALEAAPVPPAIDGAAPRRAALLINEEAGRARAVDADRVVRLCRQAGIEVVDVQRPTSPDAMARAAARLADQVPGLLVAGGDGALNATLPGCLHRPIALGILPTGTVNVWAREIGLPQRLERAVEALARGSVQVVDVGQAVWPETDARAHFLLMAGIGFDGEVTRLVDRHLKRRLGRGAYALAALAAYFRHEPYAATVEVDGVARRIRLTQLVVANCRRYGGDLPLAASAEPADGWLDLWTLGPAPRLAHAARFFRIVLAGADQGDRLVPARARRVRIVPEHEVAIQLDGDPMPPYPGPIELSVVPATLRVWLPSRG
ncbi:MAG TPA: diacylglycerol kinase family protein [Chloroflexota bacterium]|nr:diacylglycerol kinase family protein [Chloroflexota bacterium]